MPMFRCIGRWYMKQWANHTCSIIFIKHHPIDRCPVSYATPLSNSAFVNVSGRRSLNFLIVYWRSLRTRTTVISCPNCAVGLKSKNCYKYSTNRLRSNCPSRRILAYLWQELSASTTGWDCLGRSCLYETHFELSIALADRLHGGGSLGTNA